MNFLRKGEFRETQKYKRLTVSKWQKEAYPLTGTAHMSIPLALCLSYSPGWGSLSFLHAFTVLWANY